MAEPRRVQCRRRVAGLLRADEWYSARQVVEHLGHRGYRPWEVRGALSSLGAIGVAVSEERANRAGYARVFWRLREGAVYVP